MKKYTITYVDFARTVWTLDIEAYDIFNAMNIVTIDRASIISIALVPQKATT